MIDVLLEAARLKQLKRAGWVREGITSPESVAGHSWGIAWLVLLLLPEEYDRELALTYAILHDLPEVRVGDITPRENMPKEEKHARERLAMAGLLAPLDKGDHLRAVWDAYEARSTPEALFVCQLDKLDMAIQAVVYAECGHTGLHEFLDSAEQGIEHPHLCALLQQLRERMENVSP